MAPFIEKIWKVLGREFGEDAFKKAIVLRALYGLKSSRSALRNHLADCMKILGFLICPSDLNLWMNPIVRPEAGFNYYACVLIYVYYVMVIHHGSNNVLIRIDE